MNAKVIEKSGCGAVRGFGSMARLYELLAFVYSLGSIARAKRTQLKWLQSGQKVLYLGVGAGEDALAAAQAGVELTCLDVSPAMLALLKGKLDRRRLSAELICGDAFSFSKPMHYDAVVCNFFLNCFDHQASFNMLAHAACNLKPGGLLLVADVAVPQGNAPSRLLAKIYLRAGIYFYWLCGMVELHGIHDYRGFFNRLDLELHGGAKFRLAGVGPVVFESLVARKKKIGNSGTQELAL